MYYEYSNIKKLLVCGNISDNLDNFIKRVVSKMPEKGDYGNKVHPKEIERRERINRQLQENPTLTLTSGLYKNKSRYSLDSFNSSKNNLIVVCGSNTFYNDDYGFYLKKLEELNEVLSMNESHVVFIRGNDNVTLFKNNVLNLSNIKCIDDFGVIKVGGFNMMCIGGSISIDREWRKRQQERIGKRLYDENEGMDYRDEDVDKVFNELPIHCILSSCGPSFSNPGMGFYSSSNWVRDDKKLYEDMKNERLKMDALYNKLIEKNKKPYLWIYSKFNMSSESNMNDMIFLSINNTRFININETMHEAYSISDITKIKGDNTEDAKSKSKRRKKKEESRMAWDVAWEIQHPVYHLDVGNDRQIVGDLIEDGREIEDEVDQELDEGEIFGEEQIVERLEF